MGVVVQTGVAWRWWRRGQHTHNESAEYTMLIPHFLVLICLLGFVAGVWFGTWSATFLACWRGGELESWAFVWSLGAVSTLTFCLSIIHKWGN